MSRTPAGRSPRRWREVSLDPAALAGDEHCLGSIGGADLAVDVVQVRAHGAGGEAHLGGDLLVDLALCEAAQGVDLALGERTGLAAALARGPVVGKLVDDLGQAGVGEPAAAGHLA